MARTQVLSRVNRVLSRRDTSSEVQVPDDGRRRRVAVLADSTDTVMRSAGGSCVLELEVNDGSGWRHSVGCTFTTGPHHATDSRPHRAGLSPEPPGVITTVPPGVRIRAALTVSGQRKVLGVVIDLED